MPRAVAQRTRNRRKGLPQSLVFQTNSEIADCQPTTGDTYRVTLTIPIQGDPVSMVAVIVLAAGGFSNVTGTLVNSTTWDFDSPDTPSAVWFQPGHGMRTGSNGVLTSTPHIMGA